MIKYLFLLVTLIILIGCSSNVRLMTEKDAELDAVLSSNETVDWKNFELNDALTDEKYKISDFEGEVILLESFATWCPTCLRQQKELKKVDNVIHISLDTDPNEEESLIKAHAERNDLEWRFSVSPPKFTKALLDEFGPTIVSAPLAPTVLICEDQKTRFLKTGVKSAEELKEEIVKGCE